ncbi:neuroligin-4, Y-linked-like [Achroia grisella]|uniref:neuroligin-4, Y-linked-like n=1 Tax=Achroia grisella TaxID=688607 RepID=UPI0027D31B6B|nr:neuroligin-4, Y-linked-like [Achroia grisella]
MPQSNAHERSAVVLPPVEDVAGGSPASGAGEISSIICIKIKKVPIEKLQAPQMASSGLKVTHYKSKYYSPCYQSPKTYTEDYLKLNVSAKKNNVSKPVIAWLEGKEYSSLEMTTLFKNLVLEDIVVVTINYRISIFGFLCLGVPEAPGNAGLKDVILALQWIEENINKFGGDPKNVMLLGHGSGAAMVDLITMSPFSEDLVHKAFVISGSALAPWAISYDPIGYANIVAENLQYSGKSPMELAMKFKSTRLNVLLAALEVEFTNNTALFAPCVENDKLQNVFLNDTPINILKNGSFNHIPYVAAYTQREGTIKAKEFLNWRPKMESDFTQFIPGDLEFGSEINKTIAMNNIREFYFHNTTSINITEYLDYYRDTSVIVPLIRGVTARAETSTANVYLLEYAYHCISNADWPFNDISVVENSVKQGSRDNVLDKNMTKHEEDAKKSLINYIISFAKTG